MVFIRSDKKGTRSQRIMRNIICSMSEYNIDIADMQCWVFRMAQSKWKMSLSDCAELFKKYDILGFIADCYDILHLNSYECAFIILQLLEAIMKNQNIFMWICLDLK